MDPFSCMGLAPRFGLSVTELDRRQRELHVERRSRGPEALEEVNAAVRLLRDPATRAEQLLQLRGWTEHGASDPALLERVFTDREQIEAARRRSDRGALAEWVASAKQRRQILLDSLTRTLDGEPASAGLLPQIEDEEHRRTRAWRLLGELRYLTRALRTADAALEDIDDANAHHFE